MNRIVRCDWLPERTRWRCLARSGLPAVSWQKIVFFFQIINLLLTKFVKNGGRLAFLACLWTSTPFKSTITQKKKNGQYSVILVNYSYIQELR